MRWKVLIVDDEVQMLQMLRDFFRLKDYEVLIAHNGKELMEKLKYKPDIILLDINMPEMNGFDICKQIRDEISIPILFITARASEVDKIKGLSIGGDDYITKPFSLEELAARVNAHLRRELRKSDDSKKALFGDLWINYSARTVHYGTEEIYFTKTEFDIIELLSLSKSKVFDREDIYTSIWGLDGLGDNSVIAEHIRRIRAKLAKLSDTEYIETVWGVGYKWVG